MFKTLSTLFLFNLKQMFKNIGIIIALSLFILTVSLILIFGSMQAAELGNIIYSHLIRLIAFILVFLVIFVLSFVIMINLFIKQKQNGIISIEIRSAINYKRQFLIRFLVYFFLFLATFPIFIVISLICQFAILKYSYIDNSIVNYYVWSIVVFVLILPIILFPIISLVILVLPIIWSAVLNIIILATFIIMPFIMADDYKSNSNDSESLNNLVINFELKEGLDFYNIISNEKYLEGILNDSNDLGESKFLTQIETNLKGKLNYCGNIVNEINMIPYKKNIYEGECNRDQYLINALSGETHMNINYLNENKGTKYALEGTEIFKIINEWHQYVLENENSFSKIKNESNWTLDLRDFVDLLLKNQKFKVYENLLNWIADFNNRLNYYQNLDNRENRMGPDIFNFWNFEYLDIDEKNPNLNKEVLEENKKVEEFYTNVPELKRLNEIFILLVINNSHVLQNFNTYYSYEQYSGNIKYFLNKNNLNLLNYFNFIYNWMAQNPVTSDMLTSSSDLLSRSSTLYYQIDENLIKDFSEIKKSPLISVYKDKNIIMKKQLSAGIMVLIQITISMILILITCISYKYHMLK